MQVNIEEIFKELVKDFPQDIPSKKEILTLVKGVYFTAILDYVAVLLMKYEQGEIAEGEFKDVFKGTIDQCREFAQKELKSCRLR